MPVGLSAAAVDAARYFGWLFVTIVPLFFLAAFLVGLAHEYVSPDRIRGALERRDGGSGNVAAAGVGAVTPFCSCSSVPMVAGLLQAGAPLGIVFSFLLASPLINEIAVPLLAALFGLEVAVLYVAIMFVAAVLGGLLLGRVMDLDRHVKSAGVDSIGTAGPAVADGGTAAVTPDHRARFAAAARHAAGFLRGMLPYVLLGMVVAALIHGLVPVAWLSAVLGPSNPAAVPLAVLAGVPLYFSLSATLPVAAALVSKGIPIGTVLALLVGVVGVSLPNLILLNKLFTRRLLAVYVATVVSIGITVGVVFNGLGL